MTWMVMLAVGVGSYVLRALPVFAGERVLTSPGVERVIGYAGTAALAALITTGLRAVPHAPGEAAVTIAVGAAALTVAVRRGSMLRVLLAGASVYAAGSAALWLLA
jgi:branched-subunit amino acid transport protein